MDTKQKAIGALSRAAADLFWDLWQATEYCKQNGGPGKRISVYLVDGEDDSYLRAIHDKKGNAETHPGIKVILDVLRKSISREDLDAELVEAFQTIVNKEVRISPARIGEYSIPLKHGSLLRGLAEDVINYLVIMAENTGIDNFGFIGVCPGCNGVFFKRRKDQRHCASKCKLDSWNARKKAQAESEKEAEKRK